MEPLSGGGAETESYTYRVFGAIRSQSGSSPNEFKFTGEQVDSSGLQYLRARYYDPSIGRFLSQDPLPVGHPYAYVRNNPVNLVDPSGLCVPGVTCPPGMERGRGDKEGSNFTHPMVVYLIPKPTPTPTPTVDPPICARITPEDCAVQVRGGQVSCWYEEGWGLCRTWDWGFTTLAGAAAFVARNPQCFGNAAIAGIAAYSVVQTGGATAPTAGQLVIWYGTGAAIGCANAR